MVKNRVSKIDTTVHGDILQKLERRRQELSQKFRTIRKIGTEKTSKAPTEQGTNTRQWGVRATVDINKIKALAAQLKPTPKKRRLTTRIRPATFLVDNRKKSSVKSKDTLQVDQQILKSEEKKMMIVFFKE